MIATLTVINQMQADGIIGSYAIGGGRRRDLLSRADRHEFIEAGALEPGRLNPILERHHLLGNWWKFGDRFFKRE